jgi:hypothetical protein
VQAEPKLDGETAGAVARPSPRLLRWLPDTADRVETHLTRRKQSTAYLSTRHSSRDANFHETFDSTTRRTCGAKYRLLTSTSHESPVTNHRPLTGTRERLESHVSHRKQSTACTSNQYSSRLTCFQILTSAGCPRASTAGCNQSQFFNPLAYQRRKRVFCADQLAPFPQRFGGKA